MHSVDKVKYPVYRIRKYMELKKDNGVTYINTHKGQYILDNTNLAGNFVARRRKIRTKEVYPLYKPIMNHRLLSLDKMGTGKYVDSDGMLFEYKKTTFVPLTWHWIKNKIYTENHKIIITAQGLPCKFEVEASHRNTQASYIGVLAIAGGYMLYNLLKEKRKNSRVKI